MSKKLDYSPINDLTDINYEHGYELADSKEDFVANTLSDFASALATESIHNKYHEDRKRPRTEEAKKQKINNAAEHEDKYVKFEEFSEMVQAVQAAAVHIQNVGYDIAHNIGNRKIKPLEWEILQLAAAPDSILQNKEVLDEIKSHVISINTYNGETPATERDKPIYSYQLAALEKLPQIVEEIRPFVEANLEQKTLGK